MTVDPLHAHPCSTQQVIHVRTWTHSLLSFTMTRPPALRFMPGQYARIGLPASGQPVWRAFSFVSAPDEPVLEFVAVLIPDGLFSSRLRTLQAGDTLLVEHENYGFMTADRFADGEDAWLLGTGTGIGPFVSMLRDDALWKQFRRIVLVHGVRHGTERIYHDELLQRQAAAPPGRATLSLLYCISQPAPGEAGGRQAIAGRLTEAWDRGTLETVTGLPITAERSRVMLCGNPQMIEDMRARLHGRGMKPCRRMAPGQFLTENYW